MNTEYHPLPVPLNRKEKKKRVKGDIIKPGVVISVGH